MPKIMQQQDLQKKWLDDRPAGAWLM